MIAYNPQSPTRAKIVRVTNSKFWPKTLEIKSYLKKPTRPQFIAPIIISASTKFFKDITPFKEYFNHFLQKI